MGWARILPLALTLLVSLTLVPDEAEARRVALVVGNGAYRNAPALPNPPNDSRAVADALRDLGFEVIEREDLDQSGMRATLAELAGRLDGAEAALLFYAGHGVQVNGRNYLIPIDATLNREADLYLQALSLDDALRVMEAAVPTRLVILDACRDNPFTRSLARAMGATRSASVGVGLAPVEAAAGTLIAYATAPDTKALDGDGANSPFTAALLKHMGTPGIDVRQMFGRVGGSVIGATNGRQVPWVSSSLVGDFSFKAPNLQAEPQPVTSAYGGADQLAFAPIRDSSRARDFEIFLERYPESPLAPFARSRLEDIQFTAAATITSSRMEQTAQPTPTARSWEKTFGGQDRDQAQAITTTPDGKLIVVGQTYSNTLKSTDTWILKLDKDGRELWLKAFGGPKNEELSAVAALPDGGIVVAGQTSSKSVGQSDAWVLRLDANGKLIWEKTFGGVEYDYASSVALMPNGNLVIAGVNNSKGVSSLGFWVFTLNADGQLLWEKIFVDKARIGDPSIAVMPDSNLVLAGSTEENFADKNARILKLDKHGELLWSRTFEGEPDHSERISSLAVMPDGGLAMAGSSGVEGSCCYNDIWVLRLDSDGRLLWQQIFDGRAAADAKAVVALSNGGLAVAGYLYVQRTNSYDAVILSFNPDGQLLWDETFGGREEDLASGMVLISDGGFIIAGTTASKGAGQQDAWVFRLSSEGRLEPTAAAAR